MPAPHIRSRLARLDALAQRAERTESLEKGHGRADEPAAQERAEVTGHRDRLRAALTRISRRARS